MGGEKKRFCEQKHFLSKMMKSMLKRRRQMKSDAEIRNFEIEVDDFAASFVGSRGDPPERGTFHVVNLAKRFGNVNAFFFRTYHTKIILFTQFERRTDGPGKKMGDVRIVVVSDTHGLHGMLEIPDGDACLYTAVIYFFFPVCTTKIP